MKKPSASVKELKKYLNIARGASALAKGIVENITCDGRLLVDSEDFHAVEDLLLIAGNDIAIAETNWRRYERIGFGSSRYVIRNQEKVNQ